MNAVLRDILISQACHTCARRVSPSGRRCWLLMTKFVQMIKKISEDCATDAAYLQDIGE